MNAQPTVADQSVLCAHCDMPNAPDTAYCVGCGVPLRAEAQPPAAPIDAPLRAEAQPPAPPIDAPRQQYCGTCGITNPAGALYCVNCGVSLADPRPHPIHGYAPPAGRTADWTLAQHIYIGVAPARAEVPLLARALWFVFIGLWAGQLWLIIAWLLNLTLIGLPLGMWMLSRLPQVMTLRSTPTPRPAPVSLGQNAANFAVRAVYFVLIGWWVSLLWMELAWLIAASAIGLPLSFLMFERVATLTTLAEA
ncbi:MAG: double zinc ribbon domain-containing protein [Roseiflexaceae bacterium]